MDAAEIRRLQALAIPRLHWQRRQITACQADSDGDCVWQHCPQLRDGEPIISYPPATEIRMDAAIAFIESELKARTGAAEPKE